MNNKCINLKNDSGNFYFYKYGLDKNFPKNLILKDLEFKLLFISKDFSIYSEEKIEKNIEFITRQEGLTQINFFGLGANKLEDIAENKIVNLRMENNNEKTLSIVVSSEDDFEEDGFFYIFKSGGFSIKDENEYVKENYIFYDDDELYEKILRLM